MPEHAPINHNCPYCGDGMAISSMTCGHCHVRVEADFPMSHIGRLPVEHQRFIEMFVLCGGNLKQLAEQVGVSYPTIRSRLDRVMEALQTRVTAATQTPPAAAAPALAPPAPSRAVGLARDV